MTPKILFIVYDNGSRINVFPQSTAYLMSYLRNNGFDSDVYLQDVYHHEDEHLTGFLKNNKYDIICLGFIGGYYQYKKVLSLSKIINESINRPSLFILGGHGPSPDPLFFLKKTNADVVVRGEGEITLLKIVKFFSEDRSIDFVDGISYIKNDEIVHNHDRELIENIDTIPIPDYKYFPIEYYKNYPIANSVPTDSVMSVLSSRGCPFKCTFCYRMDSSYRKRKPDCVMDEIEYLMDTWGITYINFVDELLMSGRDSMEEFCDTILSRKLKFKWYCNGRLNFADRNTLSYMKKAGCVYINYGVESLDNTVLKNIRKGLTEDKIRKGVQNTIDEGIDPGINIMFGNKGDTPETLDKSVDFLIENTILSEMRTVRPVTPYPGSQLFYDSVKDGLLDDTEDFYENKHKNSDLLTVNFTEMEDDLIYKLLSSANEKLIRKFFYDKLSSSLCTVDKLYKGDISFRGFR